MIHKAPHPQWTFPSTPFRPPPPPSRTEANSSIPCSTHDDEPKISKQHPRKKENEHHLTLTPLRSNKMTKTTEGGEVEDEGEGEEELLEGISQLLDHRYHRRENGTESATSGIGIEYGDEDGDYYSETVTRPFQLRESEKRLLITTSYDTSIPRGLFANEVWMGSSALAEWIDVHPDIVKERSVLELGAGAALPSLVALAHGARRVVITDYPNAQLLDRIRANVLENHFELLSYAHGGFKPTTAIVAGHLWGETDVSVPELLMENGGQPFDVLLLAEVLWRHEQHANLLMSVSALLKAPPSTVEGPVESFPAVYIAFCHHIPGLEQGDLGFFELAKQAGMTVEQLQVSERKHVYSDKLVPTYLYRLQWRQTASPS